MAPSAQLPETAVPAASLRALDEIEARWREGLSLIHAGDPARAQREVEAAGEMLARIGDLEELRQRLDPERLANLARQMARLSALHGELTAQSRRAQTDLLRALAAARHGKLALDAYGALATGRHACDEVG
jgi:hypothetical protein